MFNQADILKAIQAGQDPQEIANSFADALNAAVAEANTAAEKVKTREAKVAQAQVVLTAVADFVEKFYPEMYSPAIRKVDPIELVDAADQAYEEVQKLSPVLNDLEELFKSLNVEDLKEEAKVQRDPLEAFLRANGLKD